MLNLLDPFFAAFARLTVARGVLFPDLVERMKSHYVRAAERLAKGKITDSKLSVMTGLQRRDIVRLKGFAPKPPRPNPLAQVIALWQTHPGFGDGGPLPRQGETGSFEALARMVSKDIHPRTMLDQLIAAGTVQVSGDTEEVALLQASYQPLSGSEDQLSYLAHNLGDHLDAATQNVLGQDPPHFERAVHYSGFSADQIKDLQQDFDHGQMRLLEALSRKAAAMKSANDETETLRFRAGGYFFVTEKDAE